MMRIFLCFSIAALAACSPEATKSGNDNAAVPPPVRNAVAATPAAAPALAPSVCPPAPTLVLLPDFPDPHRDFAPGGMGRQSTESSFAEAYALACRRGILRGHRIGEGAADPSRLYLRNAPDSNMPSIYVDDGEGNGPAGRRAVLEFRFFDANGQHLWPMVEELAEAIYCHVHGATPREQEESGRCLVD